MLSLLPVVMRFAVLRPNGESPLDKPRQAGGHSDHQTYNCYPRGMKFLVQGIANEPAQHCRHRQSDAQFDHLLRLDPAFFPVALLVCHQDNLTADQSKWQLARRCGQLSFSGSDPGPCDRLDARRWSSPLTASL